jgi:hypothetical protein
MGYDERGHCPMLVDGACSIYEHRPRTCRTYDCRVLPAAGLEQDDDGKALIARRARRWRFSHPTEADERQHEAVRAAAAYLRDQAGRLPAGTVPGNTTQLAVLAAEVHDAFLTHDRETGRAAVVTPAPEAVRVAVRRRTGDRR